MHARALNTGAVKKKKTSYNVTDKSNVVFDTSKKKKKFCEYLYVAVPYNARQTPLRVVTTFGNLLLNNHSSQSRIV